jgi:hypothetical protein
MHFSMIYSISNGNGLDHHGLIVELVKWECSNFNALLNDIFNLQWSNGNVQISMHFSMIYSISNGNGLDHHGLIVELVKWECSNFNALLNDIFNQSIGRCFLETYR